MGTKLGISERSVHSNLKTYHFHAYHIQALGLCEWARFCLKENPLFLWTFYFLMKPHFTTMNAPTLHNYQNYPTENPRIVREIDYQCIWWINVWWEFIGEHVVGPYFFNSHLTGKIRILAKQFICYSKTYHQICNQI